MTPFGAIFGIKCGRKVLLGWPAAERARQTRAELELLGDAWQLARQEVRDLPTSCDVQSQEHDLCNGWDDFTDSDLSTFYRELTGKEVTVDPGGSGPRAA